MGVPGSGLLAAVKADADAVRGEFRETQLPGGVRVLTEHIPGVRSVSAGIWIRHGAAHDPPKLAGISHLLEHLVFKGTSKRSAHEIALALERLGGSLDAFTSKEHTAFQARVLSEHLPIAWEVLADLVLNPLLRETDLALEREVVLEEISTVDDTPDDLVFELHGEALWDAHPYGQSILGTRTTVGGLDAEALQALHRERYLAGPIIVAAAGCLDHQRFVEEVSRSLGSRPELLNPTVPEVSFETTARDVRVPREGAQTHLVFGTRTPPRADAARFPLILLSAAFGGGMGSRLFQKIREELALGYSVYSFQSFHSRAGIAGVYVGTRPEWGDRAAEAVLAEYAKLAKDGLGPREFDEVKNQVKGQVMLSLESTGSRLFRLAGFALHDQPTLTLDELLASIEAVTRDEVADLASHYFDPERQVVLRLGPGEG
ncbi:MAG: pitrilysin family protein [Gemmatimonadota bacterium]